ncbi:GNAT family N-acetyltransferase [uncultured Jatrophihabitans sp.]|uniref:GNAT family N-acetyltransferase n=1 Tax=uncultured Jatrophihabitans sp. TaxID=1610747 RepID=UPI0035CB439D
MTLRVAMVEAAVTTELRRAVLRPHHAVGTLMFGDDLPDAVHLAALDGDVVVGACVLVPHPYPHRNEPAAWQLRGMATDPARRSQGVGAQVLGGAVDAVTDRGGRLLWCMARQVAVAFYERNGFVVDTAEYVEPYTGLPHHDMYRRVSAG